MYDFKKVEEEAGKLVKKTDIKKAVSDDKKRNKLFSFLEGPPTANAPPALHHLEVRTFKDIINKFRYMKGYNVPRRAGWDCHGLPIEVQVEKKLGLNSKKDIVKFGVEKFIKLSKESVFSYVKDWEKSTEKLGYWIDLENRYATLDNDYIESIWWSLKELYRKKLLYEAHKVVPFCPRCQTPLSSHEVAQGYKEVSEESVYVKFKIKSKPKEYILAWTTTPWTLPGNVALAVGKDIDYVKIELENGERFILGKERLSIIKGKYKVVESIKGKKLEGIEYEPLFDIKETQNNNSHKVILADFVNTEDGTGVVHTAVMYGEEDYEVGVKVGLPQVHTVGEDGKFLDIVHKWKGIFVKDAEMGIKEDLRERNLLYRIEKTNHEYPFCWRCDSPLLYYAIKSWFIRVSSYKKRLVELNKKINWTPKHIKEGRFGEWLENVKDWALSRKKFWGTPLPVWRCDCGNEEVIGSVEELKRKSAGKINDKEINLHKPWIDNIKIKCRCGKEMSRVDDVIDCWYDSGSSSFAQFHYPFENREEFKKRFPYDFIAEAIDQTRGWFYTLHVLGALLFNNITYKNVICAGHIVDENGEKMSKSKGNILNPDKVLEEVGVDATRLQFCTVDIGSSKRFGVSIVKESVLPFLNVLWNTFQFYQQINNSGKAGKRIEDEWIFSRLNSVIKEVSENLEKYQIEKALSPLMNFVVNDFSKKYIKIIRDRDDKNVKKVIGEILDCVSRMLAPYAPNITEVIHEEFGKESVHLSSWPKHDERKIDEKLEKDFEIVMKFIEIGLRERDKVHIGLKWPLSSVKIYSDKKVNKELEEIIMKQLNVKKIEFQVDKESKEDKIELNITMTDELETEGFAREISRAVQSERKKQGFVKTNKINLLIETKQEFLGRISLQKKFISERTGSKNVEFSDISDDKKKKLINNFSVKIKDIDFEIYFEKTK
ncbi:MAG: isoleucine--tRNA ligase [Nanoarchaeota archaeon]